MNDLELILLQELLLQIRASRYVDKTSIEDGAIKCVMQDGSEFEVRVKQTRHAS